MKKISNQILFHARRKTSLAQSVLTPGGSGKIFINNVVIEQIHPEFYRNKITSVLEYIPDTHRNSCDIFVTVRGGGISSQIDAAIVCIMNSYCEFIGNEEFYRTLKEHDRSCLVSDSRRKAQKTILGPGARSREQKSYR